MRRRDFLGASVVTAGGLIVPAHAIAANLIAVPASAGGGSPTAHSHFSTESVKSGVRAAAHLRSMSEVNQYWFTGYKGLPVATTQNQSYNASMDAMEVIIEKDNSMNYQSVIPFTLIEPPDNIYVQYEVWLPGLLVDNPDTFDWNAEIGTNTCKVFRVNDSTESQGADERVMDQRLNDGEDGLFKLEGYFGIGPIRTDLTGGEFDYQPGGDTTQCFYTDKGNWPAAGQENCFCHPADTWCLVTWVFDNSDTSLRAYCKSAGMSAAVQTIDYDCSSFYVNGWYADEMHPVIHISSNDPACSLPASEPCRDFADIKLYYRNCIASINPIEVNPDYDSGSDTWVVAA